MNCPNCQSPLPDGAKFCAKCGTDLRGVQTPVQETSAPQEQPAAQPYQEQPQDSYREQFQQYQQPQDSYQQAPQPQQYEPQQYAPQQYAPQTPVLTQVPPKKKNKALPIIIAVVAVVVAAGIVFGVIFGLKSCSNPSKGSYKDALNDAMALMSAGKLDEAMEKYSIEGKNELTSDVTTAFNMISNLSITADVYDEESKVYPKGTSEFDKYISYVTTDSAVQDQTTEVAFVKAKISIKGTVLGQEFSESDDSSFYMARVNGEWKFGSGGMFSTF